MATFRLHLFFTDVPIHTLYFPAPGLVRELRWPAHQNLDPSCNFFSIADSFKDANSHVQYLTKRDVRQAGLSKAVALKIFFKYVGVALCIFLCYILDKGYKCINFNDLHFYYCIYRHYIRLHTGLLKQPAV